MEVQRLAEQSKREMIVAWTRIFPWKWTEVDGFER